MKKPRFVVFDGLRGIVALLVATRHISFWEPFFFRTYLAVDIFFILSGIVIGSAYDEKLRSKSMSFLEFLKIRLIRLYPVYFFSVVISFCIMFGGLLARVGSHDEILYYLLAGFLMLLFLPFKIGEQDLLYPMNGVYWSLGFELLVNFLYAKFIDKINNFIILSLCIFFLFVAGVCFFINGSGDLGFKWSFLHILGGCARAFWGIGVGLLIYRRGMILNSLKFKNFYFIVLLYSTIVFIMIFPSFDKFNWIVDFVVIAIIFPVFAIISSSAYIGNFSYSLMFLGMASYPLYVFHVPFAKIFTYLFPNLLHHKPYVGLIFMLCLIFACGVFEKYINSFFRKTLIKYL